MARVGGVVLSSLIFKYREKRLRIVFVVFTPFKLDNVVFSSLV